MNIIWPEVNDMADVKISLQFDPEQFIKPIEQLNQDPRVKLAIHNALAKRCDPYVPFLKGPLSQTLDITPEGVTYKMVYAQAQYYGLHFRHTLEFHPLATAFWDKAMMRDHGEEFVQEVKEIIKGEWLHGR